MGLFGLPEPCSERGTGIPHGLVPFLLSFDDQWLPQDDMSALEWMNGEQGGGLGYGGSGAGSVVGAEHHLEIGGNKATVCQNLWQTG